MDSLLPKKTDCAPPEAANCNSSSAKVSPHESLPSIQEFWLPWSWAGLVEVTSAAMNSWAQRLWHVRGIFRNIISHLWTLRVSLPLLPKSKQRRPFRIYRQMIHQEATCPFILFLWRWASNTWPHASLDKSPITKLYGHPQGPNFNLSKPSSPCFWVTPSYILLLKGLNVSECIKRIP